MPTIVWCQGIWAERVEVEKGVKTTCEGCAFNKDELCGLVNDGRLGSVVGEFAGSGALCGATVQENREGKNLFSFTFKRI